MEKKLDVIIVNWNTGRLLEDCLHSIILNLEFKGVVCEIIVVDNNSTDESIKADILHHSKIKVLKRSKNYGFASSCNYGSKFSHSDYILFLNPDTVLQQNTLQTMMDFVQKEEDKTVKIWGCSLLDSNGKIQRNCSRKPKPLHFLNLSTGLNKINPFLFKSYTMKDWDHKKTRSVHQVMGSFFLIEREHFQSLNGFDEQFFMYYEELDLSLRSSKLGYKSKYISDVSISHYAGGSSSSVKGTRLFYNLSSRLKYSKKNFNKLGFAIVFLGTWIIEPITRLIFTRGSKRQISELIKGYYLLVNDKNTGIY